MAQGVLFRVNPWLKRAGWVLVAALVVTGLWRLRFDVEVLNLLPRELAAVEGLQRYEESFTSRNELVITLRSPRAETTEAAAGRLAGFLRLQSNLVAGVTWQPPWVEEPEQMADLIAYLWLNSRPELFGEITNRLAPDNVENLLTDARERLATSMSPMEIGRLSYDPFGFTQVPGGQLVSEGMMGGEDAGFASADGTYRAVFVEARTDLRNYQVGSAWLTEIRDRVGQLQQSSDWPAEVAVRYTGAPPFAQETAMGMQRDLQRSVLITILLIGLLFLWAHRSWRPLALLVGMLLLVDLGVLAAGGLLFRQLNAVSLGFAAVLLGLAVDYGLVLYQEWVAAPELSVREVRRLIGPAIVAASTTTAAAFALLNFAGLPGLFQLGSLVAIGVLLAAAIMLFLFLPLVRRFCVLSSDRRPVVKPASSSESVSAARFRLASGVLAIVAVLVLTTRWPAVDHSDDPLQPKGSEAQAALKELEQEFNRLGDPLLMVVGGRDETEVAQRLEASAEHLGRLQGSGRVESFLLPTGLWPRSNWQRQNLETGRSLTVRRDSLRAAAAGAGFNPEALALCDRVLRVWEQAQNQESTLWPGGAASRWLLKRAAARTPEGWLAAGAVYPAAGVGDAVSMDELTPSIEGVWLTGWTVLGETLLDHVEHRLTIVMMVVLIAVVGCLFLTFRNCSEVLLSLSTLAFSLIVLLAVMGILGWSWNLMNLVALPLLLGAGVDYTIQIQLGMRRHSGNSRTMRRITGRAVLLCAATTMTGFGSNSLSGNAGLASLGMVCAVGIAIVSLTSCYLLPAWWRWAKSSG